LSEGSFVWSNGDPVTYTRWGPDEPNEFGPEDWVHVFPLQDDRYPGWNDAPNEPDSFGLVMRGVVEVVPEPGTLALTALALPGLFLRRGAVRGKR
jgi:hypothetical protein